jgi:hypothetical protein
VVCVAQCFIFCVVFCRSLFVFKGVRVAQCFVFCVVFCRSLFVFKGVRVAQCFVFCVVFCRSLFVFKGVRVAQCLVFCVVFCRSLFVLFILVILVCSSSFLQLLNTPLISSNFLPSNIGLARKEKSQKNYGLLYPWGDKILFSLNSLVLLEIYSDIFKLSP